MLILENWSESFFLCSFKNIYFLSSYLHIKHPLNAEWLLKVKPATPFVNARHCKVMMFCKLWGQDVLRCFFCFAWKLRSLVVWTFAGTIVWKKINNWFLNLFFKIKMKELRCIALFAVIGFIKKLSLIDYVNIYLFLIFFQLIFPCGKVRGYSTLLISWFTNLNLSHFF